MSEDKLKITFEEYVNKFDMKEHKINLKYLHSLRVMEISKKIAESENFSKKDKKISVIVGLLHDYARFPQWTKYKTFSDLTSIDHGDYAVKLLFDNKEIDKFNIEKEYYDKIYDAIKYHNKYNVPTNINQNNTLICKIIRDADKLDILYLLGIDKELLLEDNQPITERIKKDFYNNLQTNNKDIKSKNDKILSYLSMIYDLNFDYSYKYIKENNLINKIYNKIQNKAMFKEYFEYIEKYINERIEQIC